MKREKVDPRRMREEGEKAGAQFVSRLEELLSEEEPPMEPKEMDEMLSEAEEEFRRKLLEDANAAVNQEDDDLCESDRNGENFRIIMEIFMRGRE